MKQILEITAQSLFEKVVTVSFKQQWNVKN